MMNKENKLIVFDNQNIRRTWFDGQWYYGIVDVVGVLTDSKNPTDYLKKLRKRDAELQFYLGTNCPHLELLTNTGKKRLTLAGNIKAIFRLVQSIPSKKAEPFKLWLAEVGNDRINEIENPELAQARMKAIYEQKGYDKNWIDKRLRGIAIRQNLTDEWQDRGITTSKEFGILTAEISKATFGMTPSEYKKLKGIKNPKENLRDGMNDLELIFTMLGEKVTTEISKKEKPDGFDKNKQVAKRGGKVAGNAKLETEKELGHSIVSDKKYLE
ncbi:DNA-damage-inducible protein d [uncultured Candidatus Thioglobus sp.]|nr:DNA-damage-inducible protein d [uncultured Candidatus Thioglobus sp.]